MEPILNIHTLDLIKYAKENKIAYSQANPFPSIAFADFFNPSFLDKVLTEFPDLSKQDDSIHYNDPLQRKFAGNGETKFGPATKRLMHFLNSQTFLKFINELTAIKEPLFSDPYFEGAGLHEIKPGGLLKVHADFNKHPINGLDRRVNFIIYLNKDWQEEYGGHFELWNEDMSSCAHKILPTYNTVAIFSTTSISYHGHPNPLTCPVNRSRKSLALYYYSNGRPEDEKIAFQEGHNSLYMKRKYSSEDNTMWEDYEKFKRKKPIIIRAFNKLFRYINQK